MSLYARPAQDDTMAEINVTPFTDVLLVLMIIFIILAALVVPPGFQKSLGSNCPGICDSPADAHPHIAVAVTSGGKIFVGSRPVSQGAIYGVLAAIAQRDAKTTVDLIGDGRAPYGLIIRALDAAKAAGLNDVTFITE